MKNRNQSNMRSPLLVSNQNQQARNNFQTSESLPSELVQTLGDNSCPYIKKKNLYDMVAEITARMTVIRPENKWLLAWHSFIMFILLYYIFQIGLLWGYGIQVWIDELAVLYVLNCIFIVALIADCFLSTIKAYYSHGLLVTHPRLIVKRYLKVRFYIDILAIISIAIPFISKQFALNWIKALFLLKIYSVYEIDKQFIRVSELKVSYHTFYLLSRLVLLLVLGSHYLGIWFYMIDYWVYQNNYYGPNTPNICWIYNAQSYSQLVLLQPWYGQYLYTMYFSIGTMTTIAYGDITPLNPLETLYITFALIPYTLGFAYILSQILRILMEAQASKFEHSNNLLMVSNMMKNNMIKQKTQSKVKSYFQKVWKEQIYRDREVQNQLIQKLPHRIRNELFSELYYSFFISSGLFYPGSEHVVKTNFIVALSNQIKEQRLVEDHILYKEGQQYDPENLNNHVFYFIKQLKKGNLKPSIQVGVKDLVLQTIKEGYVGIQGFYTGQPRDHWAKIVLSVLVYQLPRKVLTDKIHLATEQQLENVFLISETIDNRKCYVCNQLGHNFKACQYVTYQPKKADLVRYYNMKIEDLEIERQNLNSNKIKREKLSFNTLIIFKQIKDIRYKIKNKYEMILMDKYYRQLLLNDSERKLHNRIRQNTKDDQNLDRDREQTNLSKKSFKMSPNLTPRDGPRLSSNTIPKDINLLQSQQQFALQDRHRGESNKIKRFATLKTEMRQRKMSQTSSEGTSYNNSESSDESSVDLQNYLKQTQLYIQHLQNFQSIENEKINYQDVEYDVAKNFHIYYPTHNINFIINRYNNVPSNRNSNLPDRANSQGNNIRGPTIRRITKTLQNLFGLGNSNQLADGPTGRDLLLNESVEDENKKQSRKSHSLMEQRMMSDY